MDTRFSIAIHILVLVSTPQGRGLKAEGIARNVGTHPVRVRQILARLGSAGFTETLRGRTGGTYLAMPAEQIDLAAVYAAVYDDPELLPIHHSADERMHLSRWIGIALLEPFGVAEASMLESLRSTTISELARKVSQGYRGRAAAKS